MYNIRDNNRAKAQGEKNPIPVIGFVLLIVRYLIRVGNTLAIALTITTPIINQWVTVALAYLVSILLTSLIETLIRLVLIQVYKKRLAKAGVEPEKKETN